MSRQGDAAVKETSAFPVAGASRTFPGSSPSFTRPASLDPTTYTVAPARTKYTARRASSGNLPTSSSGPDGRPTPARRAP